MLSYNAKIYYTSNCEINFDRKFGFPLEKFTSSGQNILVTHFYASEIDEMKYA